MPLRLCTSARWAYREGVSFPLLAFIDGPEGIVVVVVLLLVFGANRVPKLARQLGQAQRELKKGIQEGFDGDKADAGKADAGNADSDKADAGTVNAAAVEIAAPAVETATDASPTIVDARTEASHGTFQPPLPPPSG